MLSTLPTRTTCLATLAAALFAISPAAFAQTEEEAAAISQEGLVELTVDHDDAGTDVIAATVEYGLGVRVADGWTVQAYAIFEPVADADGDATFENEDLYLETLSLNYSGDGYSLYVGKLDPVFGIAAALAPGLYGVEVGESFMLTEKNGVGGDVSLSAFFGLPGEQVLSAAVFAADRTFLSESLGGERPRVTLADGGPSNTKALKSWALSLDGAFDNGYGYSVGYRQLAGADGEADERMGVVGVSYSAPEDAELALSWVAEAGWSDNADGIDNARRAYYTAGGTLGLADDWFVTATASGWDENADAGNLDLRKIEASIGRPIADNLTLEFGAEDVRLAGDSQTVVGLRLSWEFG